jgi:hypothetical protein
MIAPLASLVARLDRSVLALVELLVLIGLELLRWSSESPAALPGLSHTESCLAVAVLLLAGLGDER